MAEVGRVHGLLGWCRAGFEPELAAELMARAGVRGDAAWVRAGRDTGWVLSMRAPGSGPAIAAAAGGIAETLPAPVFARSLVRLIAELRALDPSDRIGPLLAALAEHAQTPRYGRLVIEHADSEAGRPLSGLARAFGNALRPALRRAGRLSAADDPRLPALHVALLAGDHLLLGDDGGDAAASPWPGGIPRLRMPPEAPSRSALKLEEALHVLLGADERRSWLQAGMRAADLGAAPGGWSVVLARHHLRVDAVDNGPLAAVALATVGVIEHHRADGFRWQPTTPLDWMVCDMVEQPRRVASRMATWLREGWCRRTIFNLKLPMKKRWEETRLCLQRVADEAERPLELRARHLHHDREEITVYAGPAR